MKCAIDEALVAYQKNEVPVGAVIVKNNKIVAKSHNNNRSQNDPTAHAEILAIKKASQILDTRYLLDCDIFVTLEPCLMCASAISLARISRVYYGLADSKFGAYENGISFLNKNSNYHKAEIYSGFYEAEILQIMQSFFKGLRN